MSYQIFCSQFHFFSVIPIHNIFSNKSIPIMNYLLSESMTVPLIGSNSGNFLPSSYVYCGVANKFKIWCTYKTLQTKLPIFVLVYSPFYTTFEFEI